MTDIKPRPPVAQRLSPEKRARRRQMERPMSPAAVAYLTDAVMIRDGRCVMVDHTESMCDGPTEPHHIVPQRILRAHYSGKQLSQLLVDTRNAVALCRRHHAAVERHTIYLPDEVLPLGFGAFTREFGFDGWYDAEIARRV